MPDGSTSVVERIPAVEMAWRDAARHLCEKARLDFETWDFQQSFRGVESYADSSDEDVPRIAEATPTGVGLAEGMLLRTLYRDLEAIQQGTSIQAVVKSVERRGAPLLAILKDISKGLAVWRNKVGNRRLSNKVSSALGLWIVSKRRALRGALLGVRQEALRFSVQFSDATLWDRLEAEADGTMCGEDPAAVIRKLLEDDGDETPPEKKVRPKPKKVPDKVKPFRKNGAHFAGGCRVVRRLLRSVGKGRICREHLDEEIKRLEAMRGDARSLMDIAAAKALRKLKDPVFQLAVTSLRVAARKRNARNGVESE